MLSSARLERGDNRRLHDSPDLAAAIVRWGSRIREWNLPWQTGIYPTEMAAFLGLVDQRGIRTIIESGRGDHAYSTQILGKYADETGARIVSMDFSPIEQKPFNDALKGYRNLTCLAGDTFALIPIAGTLPGPIALLLDGPKMEAANRLSLVASIMYDVRVIAHHNCPLESTWGREFVAAFPDSFHYEDLGLSANPEWEDLKQWERQCVHNYEHYDQDHGVVGRSLGTSSLGMAVTGGRPMKDVFSLRGGPLRYHPFWLWLKWSARRQAVGG